MRHLRSIAVSSLILGITFDFLFYGKSPGISVFIFVLVLGLVTGSQTLKAHRLPSGHNILIWLACLFFGVMMSIRANDSLLALDLLAILSLLFIGTQRLADTSKRLAHYTLVNYFEGVMLAPLNIGIHAVAYCSKALHQLLTFHRGDRKLDLFPVLRGILITLPILVVFILLFAGADAVFRHDVRNLFDWNLSASAIGQAVVIILAALAAAGALTIALRNFAVNTLKVSNHNPQWRLGSTESSILLGSTAVLFAFFIIIQISNLFGGQHKVLTGGITYADYARNGFFELLAVAIITLALLLIANKYTAPKTTPAWRTYLWLNVILVVEVGVIMLSAFKRLGLYEQTYGFTTLRLYSHFFMYYLAVVFIMVLVKISRYNASSKLASYLFVSVWVALGIFNLMNPDAVIAHQNIDRYLMTHKIDSNYLAGLSADATPAIAEQTHSGDADINILFANILNDQQGRIVQPNHWQSYNAAKHDAAQLFNLNETQLKSGTRTPESSE